jgi:hypothetical protein
MQTLAVHVDCVACKDTEIIYVEPMDYVRWSTQGVHAQDAFPYLTADEREALTTSMCIDCIEEMYADMEEDEEEEYADIYEVENFDWSLLDPESGFPEYEADYYVDEDCD